MVSRRVQALLDQLRAQGIQDEQVLNALAAVPREKFVDEAFEQKAWDNIALPIGQGQTISQPYMVARMTELLELTPQSRVLEIGTGSGYQTAILAHLVQHESLGQYRFADRSGADNFAAIYGGANDRITRADAAVAGAGNWHRFGISNGNPGASCPACLLG